MSDLRGAIKAGYNVFKTAWNELAKTLNGAFAQVTAAKFKDIRLMSLNCEIEKDTLERCCSEIVSVVQDADSKPENLVKDCGLESLLPGDWKQRPKGAILNPKGGVCCNVGENQGAGRMRGARAA